MVRKQSGVLALAIAVVLALALAALVPAHVAAQDAPAPLQDVYALRSDIGARRYDAPAGADTFSQSLAGTLQPQAEGIAYAIYTTAFDSTETEYTARAGSNAAHAMIFLVSNRVLVKGSKFTSYGRTWTAEQVWSGNDVLNSPTGAHTNYNAVPKWVARFTNRYYGYTNVNVRTAYQTRTSTVLFDPSFSTVQPKSLHCWFSWFSALDRVVGTEFVDTSQAVSLSGLLRGSHAIREFDFTPWNTSNVTAIDRMIYDATLDYVDLSSFDVSKVTEATALFAWSNTLQSIDLSGWKPYGGSMPRMFMGCVQLKSINLYDVGFGSTAQAISAMFRNLGESDKLGVLRNIFCSDDLAFQSAWANARGDNDDHGSPFGFCTQLLGTYYDEDGEHSYPMTTDYGTHFRPAAPGQTGDNTGYLTPLVQQNSITLVLHDNATYDESHSQDMDPSTYKTANDRTDPVVRKIPTYAAGSYWSRSPQCMVKVEGEKFVGWSTKASGRDDDSEYYPLSQPLNKMDGDEAVDIASAGEVVHLYACRSADLSGAILEVTDDVGIDATSLSDIRYSYDGVPKTPNVRVIYNGKILARDVDYEVSYANNVSGTSVESPNYNAADVVVTGIGRYTGTQTKQFYIGSGNLTVAALPAAGVVGAACPAFSSEARGLAAGDTVGSLTYTVRTSQDPASAVVADPMAAAGVYWVHPSSLEASDDLANYILTWEPAPLVVSETSPTTFFAVPDQSTGTLTFTSARPASGTFYEADATQTYGRDDIPWAAARATTKKIVVDSSMAPCPIASMAWWFADMGSLTSVQGLERLNLGDCTDIQGLFAGCSTIASLDLTHLVAGDVASFAHLFDGCAMLSDLTFPPALVGSHATNLSYAFAGCSRLARVSFSGWDTAGVTDFSHMFDGCSAMATADMSGLNFAAATTTEGMLNSCGALAYLVVPKTWPAVGATAPVRMTRVKLASADASGTVLAKDAAIPAYIESEAGANAWSTTGDTTGRRCLVQFDGKGGTDASILLPDGDNSSLTFPDTSLPGYMLLGWSATETVLFNDEGMPTNGRLYQPGSTVIFGELALWQAGSVPTSITMYAQWAPDVHTVYYLPSHDSATGSVNKTVWRTTDPVAPVAQGYGFAATGYHMAGWNTAASGGGTSYHEGESLGALSSDVQLYAQWDPNPYTVAFDANTPSIATGEVAGVPSGLTFYYDQLNSLPDAMPTLSGWTFEGWSLDSTTYAHTSSDVGVYGAGQSTTDNLSADPAADGSTTVTLYAQWSQRSYQVSYDANKPAGASAEVSSMPAGPSTWTYDSPNTTAAAPSLPGWTFRGWARDAGATATDYAAASEVRDNLVVTPLEDGTSTATLHALWQPNTYNVAFDGNGGDVAGNATRTLAQTYDSNFALPADPTRAGYTFAGWATTKSAADAMAYQPVGGTVIDAVTADTKVASPLVSLSADPAATLYAAWVANEYSVAFTVANNGSGVTVSQAFPDGAPPSQAVRYGRSPTGVVARASVDIGGATFEPSGWSFNYTDASGETRSGSVDQTSAFVAYGDATLSVEYSCLNSLLAQAANGLVGAAYQGSIRPPVTAQSAFLKADSAAQLSGSSVYFKPTSENYDLSSVTVSALGAEGSLTLSSSDLSGSCTRVTTLDGVSWTLDYVSAVGANPARLTVTAANTDSDLTAVSVNIAYTRIRTSYVVEHWRQVASLDSYELVGEDTATYTDVDAGSSASYSPKTYQGFDAPSVTYYRGGSTTESTTVAPDGTTVVRLLYDRTATEVAFDTHGGSLLSSITVRYGVDLAPITPPTLAGFVLRGIYAGANAQGTRYYDGAGHGVAAWDSTAPSATLHAAWLYDLSFAQVATVADQAYMGSPVTPSPAVTWSGGAGSSRLRPSEHFAYTYSNNTDVTWRKNTSGVFEYAHDARLAVLPVDGASTYSGEHGVTELATTFDIKSADTEAAATAQGAIAAVTGATTATAGPLESEPADAAGVQSLLDRRAGIESAWSAYDALTEAQRALVTPGWATDIANLKAWLDEYGSLENATAQVVGATYDGATHECLVGLSGLVGTSLLGTNEVQVQYQRWSNNSSSWVSTGTPLAAGTYRVLAQPGATGRYVGTLVSPEFVVARRAVTISGDDIPAAGNSLTYSGQEQAFASTSNEGANKVATLVSATGLVSGHYVHRITYKLAGTDAGAYESTPYSGAAAGESLLSIYDGDGADVSSNYAPSYEAGTLTISPASLATANVDMTGVSLVRNAPTIAPQPTSVTLSGVTGKGEGGALAAGTEYAVAYRRAGTTATVDAIDAAGSWEIVVSPASGNFCDQAVLAVTVTDATYGVGYAANRPGAATHDVTGMPAAPSTWTYGTTNANALASAPSLVGWDFGGWNTSAAGSGTTYGAGTSTTDDLVAAPATDGSSVATLFSAWTPRTYRVVYDAAAPAQATHVVTGVPAAHDHTFDAEDNAIASQVPEHVGWDFIGWSIDGREGLLAAGAALSHGDNLVADPAAGGSSQVTLRATWEAHTTTVTLDAPDATTMGTTSVAASFDSPMPAATMPQRTGYDFAGYWTEGEGATRYYNTDGNSAHVWDKDVVEATLHARWTAGAYVVALSAPDATTAGTASVTATFDAPMPEASMPQRTGYDFDGYWNDATGTCYYARDGRSARAWDVASNDVTLTAHWLPHRTTVSFDANGGTGAAAGVVATYDQAPPEISGVPSRAGHTFLGYFAADDPAAALYYDADGDPVGTWDIDETTATLVARWQVRSYPVTFASELSQVSAGTFDKSLLTYADPSVTSEDVAYGGTPAGIVTAPVDVTQTLDSRSIPHRLIGWTWSYVGADGLEHVGTHAASSSSGQDSSFMSVELYGLADAELATGASIVLTADYTIMPYVSATAENGLVGVGESAGAVEASGSSAYAETTLASQATTRVRFEPASLNWELPADGIRVRDQYGNEALVARESGSQEVVLGSGSGARVLHVSISFDDATESAGYLDLTEAVESAEPGVPLSVSFAYEFARVQAPHAARTMLEQADGSYAPAADLETLPARDAGSEVPVSVPAAPAGYVFDHVTYADAATPEGAAALPVRYDGSTVVRYYFDLVDYTATLRSDVACALADSTNWEGAGAGAWTRSFTVLDAFDLPVSVPDDYAKGFLGWREDSAADMTASVSAGTARDVTLAAEWRDLVVVPRPALSGTLTYTGTEQAAPVVVPEGYELDGATLVPVGGGAPVASASGDVAGTDAGTYTATFDLADGSVWEGGSLGRLSLDWAIAPADARGADVSVADCVWDGHAQRPSPRVTLGGVELVEGRDYDVAYASNVAPGTATVTVTFRGNYAGTASATFRIREPRADARVMHRLYNPNSGEHFYTASAAERDAVAAAGWRYEGVGWYAPGRGGEPVYRLYNAYAGDHHYTLDAGERDALVAVGWTYEGVGWTSDTSRRVPVWRQYNPNALAGAHNFTTDEREHVALCGMGWRGEGVAWYGL